MPGALSGPPLLLEPLSSLPGFSLSRTVCIREIWVRGVCLLHGFYLGLIFPVCSFFVVCCLVWSSTCFFWFVFLLWLVWVSGFLHSGLFFFFSSSCSLGFFGFIWSLYGTRVYNARFPCIQLEFNILNLAQQNRLPCTLDVSLLNNFENVLTNNIVWVLVLFWKKKSQCFTSYWSDWLWLIKEKIASLCKNDCKPI